MASPSWRRAIWEVVVVSREDLEKVSQLGNGFFSKILKHFEGGFRPSCGRRAVACLAWPCAGTLTPQHQGRGVSGVTRCSLEAVRARVSPKGMAAGGARESESLAVAEGVRARSG